jgi:hypothetical protein
MKLKDNIKVVRDKNGGFLHQLGSLFNFNKTLLQAESPKFISNAQQDRSEARQDIFHETVKESKKIKKIAKKVISKIIENKFPRDANLNLNLDTSEIEKMYLESKKQLMSDDLISEHRDKLMGRNNVLGYLPFFAEREPAQPLNSITQLAQGQGPIEILSQPKIVSTKSKPKSLINIFQSQISLAQAELEKVPDLDSIVGQINSSKLSWKAKAYSKYKGLTWREIYTSLGKKHMKHAYHDTPEVLGSEKQQNAISSLAEATEYTYKKKFHYEKFAKKSLAKETEVTRNSRRGGSSDDSYLGMGLFTVEADAPQVSGLKDHFTWRDHLPAPRDQGQCGSCYLLSAVAMLEARLSIKYGRKIPLSTQYIGDCNVYSQGCGGGYSYQVLRFLREFWTFPEKCKLTTNQ